MRGCRRVVVAIDALESSDEDVQGSDCARYAGV